MDFRHDPTAKWRLDGGRFCDATLNGSTDNPKCVTKLRFAWGKEGHHSVKLFPHVGPNLAKFQPLAVHERMTNFDGSI